MNTLSTRKLINAVNTKANKTESLLIEPHGATILFSKPTESKPAKPTAVKQGANLQQPRKMPTQKQRFSQQSLWIFYTLLQFSTAVPNHPRTKKRI